MTRLRFMVPAAAIVLGSFVSVAPARSVPASAAPSIGFETPTVVDPIHTNGEPDIGIDSQGRVFVSGPTGTGTQRSTWFGSVDGGHTFRVMAQKRPPDPIIGIPGPGPGGGDTDINFDRSGKQYFADLYALACLRVAVTGPTNSGASDQENVIGCLPGSGGADRQWLAVYDPAPGTPNQSAYRAAGGTRPLIYLEYNNLAGPGPNNGAQWNKSIDGLTYTNATGDELPPGTGVVYSPFGADGYPAIDQVTGKVFQAAACDTKTCGTSSTAIPGLYLNIGTPDSTGTLHFLDATGTGQDLTKLIKIADTPTGGPDTLFSVLSMDSGRNLFVVWCISSNNPADRQVFVSGASPTTNWTKWTAPVQVSDGSTATGDATNVFPWIKAGGPGRADAVWYGSDKQVDPSSHNQQTWNVFMSQVVFPTNAASGALTGSSPTRTLVKVTPHPMHYDDICLQGANCILSTGNRNLADFFVVTIDRTGAAEIVYDDTSNGLVQRPNQCTAQAVDHCGAGVITVARQSSGMGLFGTAVSGPSNAPVSGLGDPARDALFPVIGGTNQRGMDIRSSGLQLSSDGQTLSVTMQVTDLSSPALTAAAITGSTNLQYVTRWQMGNTIYYAAMENTAANQPSFYAGAAQSIDLCSVSACFPHVLTYPEPGAGTFTGQTESGTITCPASPSADNPCTVTVRVKVADVGSPTANSLLEEVGGYALAATIQEGAETNATAEADTVPLEIDGVCCYNFKASVQNGGPGPCHEGDGEGDVSDGRGGTAHMRFDEDACEDADAESIQENDSRTGDNFQSKEV
ncbi:MAG: hypothetical protein M3Z28_02765, partial [Candidatus Dormibacteraeota bacterium]|nr:hypothetical protein [Candidatus Dormibacteraeota bacterium]